MKKEIALAVIGILFASIFMASPASAKDVYLLQWYEEDTANHDKVYNYKVMENERGLYFLALRRDYPNTEAAKTAMEQIFRKVTGRTCNCPMNIVFEETDKECLFLSLTESSWKLEDGTEERLDDGMSAAFAFMINRH